MAQPRWCPGTFVWRELMTGDVDGARNFYAGLFGWTWKSQDMGPDGTYWLASNGAQQVCGVYAKTADMVGPSAWWSYVLVEDVDAAVQRCRGAGGKVFREPMDIPIVGRFAVLADPWGAGLMPFRATHEESPPPQGPPPVGAFCWETLVTPDVNGAVAFYGKVVGFGAGRTPNGEGTVFMAGDRSVADIQAARSGIPSYWATYVAVANAEASRDRAARLGGRVVVPRIDVPRVGTISVVADPDGATLGLFQPG
jgi:predicted enzyme related to lactoylglutathione lyase